VELVQSF